MGGPTRADARAYGACRGHLNAFCHSGDFVAALLSCLIKRATVGAAR